MSDEADKAKERESLANERVGDDEVTHVNDVDDIVMPAPNASAIAAANAGAPPKPSVASDGGPVDRHGAPFNPAIHEADESGQPILGRNNKLKLKRGGDMRSHVAQSRKAPAAAGAAPGGAQGAPPPASEAPPAPADYRKVAETWVNPALDTVTATLGSEWHFDPDRRTRYIDCAERIAAKRNVQTQMAPEVELLTLLLGDVVARMELPETKKRVDGIKAKISAWWSKLWSRGKRREPEAEAAAAPAPTSRPDAPQSEGGGPLKDVEAEVRSTAPLQFPQSPRVDDGGPRSDAAP